jgi:MSHA biogenesis protein MshP
MKGFALVSAIFLLVVIAALGVFAVTISTTQQQSSAMDALGSRAYQAAKAGIEWGIYQVSNTASIRTACQNGTFDNPAILTATLTAPTGQLDIFRITVKCGTSFADITDGAPPPFRVYQLTSIAITGTVGTTGYFERQLQVAIKNP